MCYWLLSTYISINCTVEGGRAAGSQSSYLNWLTSGFGIGQGLRFKGRRGRRWRKNKTEFAFIQFGMLLRQPCSFRRESTQIARTQKQGNVMESCRHRIHTFVLFSPSIVNDYILLVPTNDRILLIYFTLSGSDMLRLVAMIREITTKWLTIRSNKFVLTMLCLWMYKLCQNLQHIKIKIYNT